MIYRIHPNIKDFLMLAFDGDKAREALGEDTDFYMDERPIAYKNNWQPMEIGFSDAFVGKNKKEIPDISLSVGKLFLSQKAYELLKNLIADSGELLPVNYSGKSGHLFNGLKTVKHDPKLSVHDPLNDRYVITFDDSETKSLSIFKAEIDYDAYFCQDQLKKIVESNNLTGVSFSRDLGNPFPEELGMKSKH
ncbi:hypothetical protein QWY82_10495 [Simiduia curdlanivorans]|uniref:Uncharacterized protein n=1 Tax=Simiduia curdlanivorans TaxID=1492769 RepID=A0ABV8V1G5_9GAMM|nr:hypothetical protein [Simiduia curdlanivorans]MDN3639239.1 hypothetical protein [Simiduia curdlanivorans]